MKLYITFAAVVLLQASCSKKSTTPAPPPAPKVLRLERATLNNNTGSNFSMVNLHPIVQYDFSEKVDRSTAATSINFSDAGGAAVPYEITWLRGDSALRVQPRANALQGLSRYSLLLDKTLKSTNGGALQEGFTFQLSTQIDSTPKFPLISDEELLTLIQRQTFKYFWDFAHPISGMARERNNSGEVVTTGGSGFGVMSIIAGIHRGFITRAQGLQRLQTMVGFLQTKAQRFKGAFPHWLNGTTGAVVPFSANDNGADVVETSFMAMGLLTAREYFNATDVQEVALRNNINTLLSQIEWSWFRRNSANVLYWHWSPSVEWAMNLPVSGWNECLITYVMAAASSTYGIPADVYTKGFARDGAIKNGKSFFGWQLPIGEDYGGPLFLSHYSFLGINPNGLSDIYANYQTQVAAHSTINWEYCKQNPKAWAGYSTLCWGLTASDIPNGYTASSPLNDVGVIAPTAAISSLPFSPQQSMDAIKFFYYTLGDKLWKEYGFVDAFKLQDLWFASSFLAIDQGPQIVMIENYRSGLLWKLFTGAPEVKAAMKKLGFAAPYL